MSSSNSLIAPPINGDTWYNRLADGLTICLARTNQEQLSDTVHTFMNTPHGGYSQTQAYYQGVGVVVASMKMDSSTILLSTSGKSYPFNDLFNPEDEFGLRFNLLQQTRRQCMQHQ